MPSDAPTLDPPPADSAAGLSTATRPCANCGTSLSGVYCAACGQQVTPLRQPIHHFLRDAFTEYFGLDGRLWTSLGLLLFRPGRLTHAYFAGQRVRYLRPLRLYLSATLLFFFLLTALDPVDNLQGVLTEGLAEESLGVMPAADYLATLDSAATARVIEATRQGVRVDSLRALTDSLRANPTASGIGVPGAEGEWEEALDILEDELDDELDGLDDSRLDRTLRGLRWQRGQIAAFPPDSLIDADAWRDAARLVTSEPERGTMNFDLPAWMPRSQSAERLQRARTGAEKAAALADFTRSMLGQLPTVMFLLLPLFAVLLKLVYVRRGWFLSEHLVFGLHTHAFAFLVFAVIAVIVGVGGGAVWAERSALFLFASIPLYFFVAQKRVYGQGWFKTAVKAFLLAGTYGIALFWGIVLAILLAAAV